MSFIHQSSPSYPNLHWISLKHYQMLSLTHVFLRTFPSDLDRRENWIMCVIVLVYQIPLSSDFQWVEWKPREYKSVFFGLRTLIFELRTFRNIPEILLLCILWLNGDSMECNRQLKRMNRTPTMTSFVGISCPFLSLFS